MGSMETFPYDAPAEIYSSSGTSARKRPVSYRRFPTSAEAIRFTVEELPHIVQRGTVMEVGDERYELADIRALYDSERYPLPRDGDTAETDERTPSDAESAT